ncbi:MAG: hypothetical protein M3042_07085 [Actinomycetota bacterium]|nr:hypothetical protein [Actinomycetota bacterium]
MKLPSFRRKDSGFDPFGDAADRMERARQARDEVGDPLIGTPLGLQSIGRPGGRWVWIFVAVALIIGIGTTVRASQPISLTRSCTKAAVKLSTDSTRVDHPVNWRATGPVGDYVLTLDATSVSRAGGGRVTVDAPAGRPTWAGRVFRMNGCTGGGRFGAVLPAGDHTVRLFRLDPSPHAVATRPLSISN